VIFRVPENSMVEKGKEVMVPPFPICPTGYFQANF